MKRIAGIMCVPGTKEIRLALYAWIVSTVVSTLLLYILHACFTGISGNPLSAEGIYHFWLPTFLNDLTYNYPGSMAALKIPAAVMIPAIMLVSVFLSGGVYSLLAGKESVSMLRLLSSSAKNFTRMFRVFLANIPNFLAAAAVPGILFYIHYKKQSLTLDESLLVFFIYGWGALTGLIFIYSIAVYDLSRIIALKGEQGVFASLNHGIKAVFSRKAGVLFIFLVYITAAALLSLIYSGIEGLLNNFPPALIIIALQQIFLFLRYGAKIMLMGAESVMADGHS